jgi:hypothetical protein
MTDQQPNKTHPIPSNLVRVNAAHDHEHDCQDSFHSVDVVHIHHESQLSFVVRYALIVWPILTQLSGVRSEITTRLFNGFI